MKNRLLIFITLFITAGVIGFFLFSSVNNPDKIEKRKKEIAKVNQIKLDKPQVAKGG